MKFVYLRENYTSIADKGKKNSIVAIVKGTKAEVVMEHLMQLPKTLSTKVKEITLDVIGSMKQIAKSLS